MHIIAKIRKEVKVKVGFVSLGCSKNLIDTEIAIGHFKNNNYEIEKRVYLAEVNITKLEKDLLPQQKKKQ